MSMNKTFVLLFYLKKPKLYEQGELPIYLRITVNGQRAELSVQRSIEPNKWNSVAGKAKGTNDTAKSINVFIDTIRAKIYERYKKMLDDDDIITADTLKQSVLGADKSHKTLIWLFELHNKEVKQLVGQEFTAGTLQRYQVTLNHLKRFLRFKYDKADITLREVNHGFISDLEFYLKTERKNGHNSALKYIKNFRKIIRIALANGWIERDPFLKYKARLKVIERNCLNESEIGVLLNKEIANVRLDQVRDIFVFCCYTGLAYADVASLSREHIEADIYGELWIKTHRVKTKTRSNIPLLPVAIGILEKYQQNMILSPKNRLLPVISNQRMNAYLKEIANVCGINKELTTHLARHTFATTVTLSNGVPIESVSKMLGHTSIKTTQHYAKILDKKVSDDMNILRTKLRGR
jgi:site-specific recombinase XerD